MLSLRPENYWGYNEPSITKVVIQALGAIFFQFTGNTQVFTGAEALSISYFKLYKRADLTHFP